MSSLSSKEAHRLLGEDLIDPAPLAAALGLALPVSASSDPIPIPAAQATAAREAGCLLVLRPDRFADGRPVTLAALLERCAARSDALLRFRGEDPWFAEEAFATTETPEPGWALVYRAPWRETLNRTYQDAEHALERRRGREPWRRRRAVEIALDCLAFAAARGERLLGSHWDWSSSACGDGALVNVGGFTSGGLEVLAYSRPVKHGALGICPTIVAPGGR